MKFNVEEIWIYKAFIKLTKKQKIAVACIGAFFVFDIAFFSFYKANGKYSGTTIGFDNSNFEAQQVYALNTVASGRKISKGTAFYRFTPEQQERLKTYYEHFGSVGINVRIGLKNQRGKKFQNVQFTPKIFTYGFLTASDFDKKGKLIKENKRILSGCDLRHFIRNDKGKSYFSNELTIEKNLPASELPVGVEISTDYPIDVYDFFVTQAKVGYDLTGEIPFYGVSSNGGNFASGEKSFDFSGCSFVFPVENTRYSVMPKVEIAFSESEEYVVEGKQLKVRLNAGGDTITIRRASDVKECELQTATMLSPFSSYDFTENSGLVTKLLMSANSLELLPEDGKRVVLPLKTDPGLILTSKENKWRTHDYEIYEWDRFPGVIFFDTIDYEIQSKFFRRLAFFAEKTGFRGKILTDQQLGDMHGYNAHDYSAESLASFFTKTIEGNVLNEKELILRDILVKRGVIIPENYGYKAGSGAVISISRESTPALRQSFIAHEAWHGIFFINEDFRNTVAAVYYTVDSKTMQFMKGYWASQPGLGYDPSDEYLMNNEFMAYIMQQPLANVAGYFVHCANRGSVMNAMPELCQWVRSTQGITFEDAGKIFESYAFDNWGLACGRVALITR